MKIGDTIWHYGHPYEITGETSKSWIIGKESWKNKVPKKNPPEGYTFSRQETADFMLIKNSWQVARAVEACRSVGILRRVDQPGRLG